eukprot:5691638-Pyramimonas_sp.AAC.1
MVCGTSPLGPRPSGPRRRTTDAEGARAGDEHRARPRRGPRGRHHPPGRRAARREAPPRGPGPATEHASAAQLGRSGRRRRRCGGASVLERLAGFARQAV